jgi:CubicO group peptidase (beta-lactamase class C family)
MRRIIAAALLGAVAVTAPLGAQAPSSSRLARIDSLLERYVASGQIAGAVTMVLQHGAILHEGHYGMADVAAHRPMAMNTLFRIASQTKAVTSVGAMMLVEEGRLTLRDPVSRWIPGFRNTMVALRTDSGRVLVPAERPITIRDLLTHTSGLSYGADSLVRDDYAHAGLGPAAGFGWYFADKTEPICTTMDRLGSLPTVSQPGAQWVYGYSLDVLGCVVERVSGMPLDRFFRERIFQPLGMTNTWFYVPAADSTRLATVYAATGSGIVRAPEGSKGQGDYVRGPHQSFSGGAGLISTAGDYARFLQMLLDGGKYHGNRLLSSATVGLMTRNAVGALYSSHGLGFGLGFQTLEDAGLAGVYGADGTFGWGGAYRTDYWVDPANDLVAVLMIQLMPAGDLDLQTRFRDVVYQALDEPAGR